jgi:Mitochondrial ribosomal protein subunit L20
MAFAVVPKRPFLSLSFLLPFWCGSAPLISRNQSSYRRIKQRLRVKPDASFSPSADQFHDNIIYNPPSSSPSIYHTPAKFLPAHDLRRTLRVESPGENTEQNLPLVFKNTQEKKYHLTPADIEEIRKLRLNDPILWSRWKLAKRFNCSPLFIAMVCEASPQKKDIQRQVLEAVRSRWGMKRRMAREDRQLRKESWGKDE